MVENVDSSRAHRFQILQRGNRGGPAERIRCVPGGTEFVITTQLGAFQVVPQFNASVPIVKSIVGPRVPPVQLRPRVSIPKEEGDPVRANVVGITPDGKRMIIGFGYFDLAPQLFSFHKNHQGSWIADGTLPDLPTDMDILSYAVGKLKKFAT